VENPNQNIHQLKLGAAGVDLDSEHFLRRHPTSFFAYTGYRRLHKFFDSEEFLGLERRFPILWMLDISNCFGSIYSHSVSWAMKSKDVVKQHIDASTHTFGGEIDCEMRDANWAETNGILVGPELSRIFAEIILQDADSRAPRSPTRPTSRKPRTVPSRGLGFTNSPKGGDEYPGSTAVDLVG
jgi:hypothetical protein